MKQEIDPHTLSMKSIFNSIQNSSFVRFIIIGLINTGLTYLIYILFNLFLNYKIAYTISYLAGIAISYFLNSKIVFRVNISLKKMILFPLVYIFQYLLNLFCLEFLVKYVKINENIAPIIVTIISIPIIFLLSRFVLKKLK